MSSARPDESFEHVLVAVQHFCGVVLFVFNGSIILLIVFDEDSRNKHYRKYICCIFSLAFDTFSDLYSPIYLMHKGLIYSDSFLSKWLSIGALAIIELFCLVEVFFSYFACVYYRRSLVLGPEYLLNFRGWRRTFLLTFVQAVGVTTVAMDVYFLRKSVLASERSLPIELDWVRNRTRFLFVLPDENMRYGNYVLNPPALFIGLSAIAMLWQLVNAVKSSSRKTSLATQRYQRLAVRSLVLQGALPTLVYIIPSYINLCMQFAPVLLDLGDDFYRFANVLSPILYICITKHTFVSSLTILYCSPSYRRKIASVIRKSRLFAPWRANETLSDSQKTH